MNTVNVSKGAASLVFFYYGDSPFFTLGQETLKLKKAMTGYGRKILLKHDFIPEPFDLSSQDEKEADVVDIPTANNFVRYVKELAEDHYMIDLWIFSHGSTGGFRVSKGQHGSNATFTTNDILTRLGSAQTGLAELPIRMIWSTLCFGASLNSAWQTIGAKVVGGATGVNFYPNRFKRFADEWNEGNVSYQSAAAASDNAGVRGLVQGFMLTHALATRKQWGGCKLGKTVLGDDDCAKAYFTKMWFFPAAEYHHTLSGKENMNRSSTLLFAGDKTMTKNSIPTWVATRSQRQTTPAVAHELAVVSAG